MRVGLEQLRRRFLERDRDSGRRVVMRAALQARKHGAIDRLLVGRGAHQHAAAWTAQGVDRAEFYVSPNPGEDLRPLARIVSGGELSRIMLALKTLATTDAPGKTLCDDETFLAYLKQVFNVQST